MVKERAYQNIVLKGEEIAELTYQPLQCAKS
jgi:hypothetical protein